MTFFILDTMTKLQNSLRFFFQVVNLFVILILTILFLVIFHLWFMCFIFLLTVKF